jgi:pilus assembly protein CpaC
MSSISEIITFDDALLFNNDDTFNFVITDGGNTFFGFLDALERRNIAKTLAEPNIVAVSGRPAQFNVGGEFPILIPQSLGTTTIEYKKFGTQIDFLPIVLGNGNIRLEVRPRISNIDKSLSPDITTSATDPPALTIREVDTAVEMKTGQTFALAGLVQERTESEYRGLPWISDLPIIGVPFRKVEENVNEIELLILVTPEFVDGMEPHEVACAGPGYGTTSPDDCDLYCSGHLEVPAPCNPISGMTACGECSQGGCASGGVNAQADSIISDGMPIEGGTGYDDSYTPTPMQPGPGGAEMVEPESMPLPPETPEAAPLPPQALNPFRSAPDDRQAARPDGVTDYTVPRPYSPSRQPVFVRNATSPDNPQGVTGTSDSPVGEGGLFGPIGYDAQ